MSFAVWLQLELFYFAPGRDGTRGVGWFQMMTEAAAKTTVIDINIKSSAAGNAC